MSNPRVLVIDDNQPFVDALVTALLLEGVDAQGCGDPIQVLGWQKAERFAFDLILLDMRLGPMPSGGSLNAAKLLPRLKTYAPSAKVVVFSQNDITVGECLQCIQFGATAVVPKGATPSELALIARVYEAIGDQNQSREELIRVLWEALPDKTDTANAGRSLEMLMTNIFNSMPTFRVVDHHVVNAGREIDILVENRNEHDFWKALNSYQLVVECKNVSRALNPTDYILLKEAVKRRRALSSVGLAVTTGKVSRGFLSADREADDIHVYYLDGNDVKNLVDATFDDREAVLRRALERQ